MFILVALHTEEIACFAATADDEASERSTFYSQNAFFVTTQLYKVHNNACALLINSTVYTVITLITLHSN